MSDNNKDNKLSNIRDILWEGCNTVDDYLVRRYCTGYLNSAQSGWELGLAPTPEDYYDYDIAEYRGKFSYNPPKPYSDEEIDYLERGLESFDIYNDIM